MIASPSSLSFSPKARQGFAADRRLRAAGLLLLSVLLLSGCNRKSGTVLETAYVSAPQVALRDRVAAVYNKVGVVKNGEPVEVLERSRNGRFVRVRAGVSEGWMEQRYLVNQQVFDGFQQLATGHAKTPVAAHALTRAELNMHLRPLRDSERLFQVDQGEKVELLERASSPKPSPPQAMAALPSAKPDAVAAKPGAGRAAAPAGSGAPPPVLEDWWLARDARGHAGWVLGRLLDVDVPLEVAQYAEGQRIIACFVLNEVTDGEKKIPQYLMLLNEPKDGQPFDYNQARVFTWNPKRSHYETAYRERKLAGVLPVRVSTARFGKEGELPVFTLRIIKDADGNLEERKYKLNGVMVRRVTAEGGAAAATPRAKRRR
ncbi:MAG TPA: SH3 domain-containing protein [Terriglobales bacterium]|nr:SH3 domain-containing protein [Terriglobales bacterium]